MDKMDNITQLYNIEKGSKIYEKVGERKNGMWEYKDSVIIFDHIDGMYSYCYVENHPNRVLHLKAWTPLVKYKDGYKIAKEATSGAKQHKANH